MRGAKPADWAQEFDSTMVRFLDDGNLQGVVDFQELGAVARSAHPTYEHFLPLLYTIVLQEKGESFSYFNAEFDLGAISMRSLKLS